MRTSRSLERSSRAGRARVRSLVAVALALGLVGCRPEFRPGGPDGGSAGNPAAGDGGVPALKTVFVIVMENQNWSSISGSSAAPYINQTLLPIASHAEQYFNPPGLHPSLPNYLWMVSGQNFGVRDDRDPSANSQASTAQLAHLMDAAGISWRSYQEDISGAVCPLTGVNRYAPKHNPFVYFDELTQGSASSAGCIAHNRPLPELETDLQGGTPPRFAFITPNLCNDMHDCGVGAGDAWLGQWVPKILASSAYQDRGALFIVWDEGSGGDGPIGLVLLSPLAKGGGYASNVYFTHSSLLRTVETGFGLTPLLGDAANEAALTDLFAP